MCQNVDLETDHLFLRTKFLAVCMELFCSSLVLSVHHIVQDLHTLFHCITASSFLVAGKLNSGKPSLCEFKTACTYIHTRYKECPPIYVPWLYIITISADKHCMPAACYCDPIYLLFILLRLHICHCGLVQSSVWQMSPLSVGTVSEEVQISVHPGTGNHP